MDLEQYRTKRVLVVLAFVLSIGFAAPGRGQQCDDLDSCTMNDMCSEGMCNGTPRTGGSCDDGNPCTTNDTCASGMCAGTPVPNGTACGGPCGGMCLVQAGFAICVPDVSRNGQPCDDGFLCTTNDICQFGACFGTLRQCADADGNPCTADFCNFETGQCESSTFPPCAPCQTCRNNGGGSFTCETAPDGTACEDFEVCTTGNSCVGGDCIGTGGPSPTPTSVVVPPTATATLPVPTATLPVPTATLPVATATVGSPTPTPTGGTPCVGDCDLDGSVTVDEIVRAVNIALGMRPVSDCLPADSNLDAQVTVDEIVTAVNNALNGC